MTQTKIDRGRLMDALVKVADQFYDGGLIILRVGRDWHVAFGSLDDWDIDQMPRGRSFLEAARTAYKKHDKKLEQEIIEHIIKPVLDERGETFDRDSEQGAIEYLKRRAPNP